MSRHFHCNPNFLGFKILKIMENYGHFGSHLGFWKELRGIVGEFYYVILLIFLTFPETFSLWWAISSLKLKLLAHMHWITQRMDSMRMYWLRSKDTKWISMHKLDHLGINWRISMDEWQRVKGYKKLKIEAVVTFLFFPTLSNGTWDVVAPWLRQWLSTGGSWVRLPL